MTTPTVIQTRRACQTNARVELASYTVGPHRLEVLTAGERRDLANALLRAAWSAALEHTRILLLDLFLEVDNASLGGSA